MDNSMRKFEDGLFEIYIDNYIEPSKDWLNLPDEELTVEKLNLFKKKRKCAKVELLQNLSKNIEGIENITLHHQVDTGLALINLVFDLEQGHYIPKYIQKILGISVETSPISTWDARHIKWQAAAQILWYYTPIHNLQTIQEEIIKFDFLELNCLTSILNKGNSRGRGLSDIIRLVAPSLKPGRKSKSPSITKEVGPIVPIPRVYNKESNQINFKALNIAICIMTKVLLKMNVQQEEILAHPIFETYKRLGGIVSEMVINWWIKDILDEK